MYPTCRRLFFTTTKAWHENPLGLPKSGTPPQFLPRKSGPPVKRAIPNVARVVVVASGKGGVGKSTVAVNLAFSLSNILARPPRVSPSSPNAKIEADDGRRRRLRVGILDLDIFGPSVPTLMGLQHSPEPELTSNGALIPLTNHNMPCMSMGFLLPRSSNPEVDNDAPVVWRGLMVQKAVQQLLFDVDWRSGKGSGEGLDVLVVDMPPGTGDVPLTLGQLVKVDGAVIVSTPQDVALSDVRKGISMFKKVSVPVTGLLLNQSYYKCTSCHTPHHLFGSPEAFRTTAARMGFPILSELPLVQRVSSAGDGGVPVGIFDMQKNGQKEEWEEGMLAVAEKVWEAVC